MRDKKILILIFMPVLISTIVFSSDMHSDGKLIIFGVFALFLLFAGYVGLRQYKESKNQQA